MTSLKFNKTTSAGIRSNQKKGSKPDQLPNHPQWSKKWVNSSAAKPRVFSTNSRFPNPGFFSTSSKRCHPWKWLHNWDTIQEVPQVLRQPGWQNSFGRVTCSRCTTLSMMHKLTAASPRKTSSPNSLRFCLNRISLSQVLATVTYSAQLYFANKKSCHPSIINEKRMTLARRSNANQPRRWSTVLPCLGGADSGTNATKLKSVSTSGPEVWTNPSNWHSEIFTKVKYLLRHFFSEVFGQKWDGRFLQFA